MKALICEKCSAVLPLDGRNGNEAASGEDSAWLVVSAGNKHFDVCTRSCAVELLADGGPIQSITDAWSVVIAEIARSVNDDDSEEDS